MKTTTLLLAIVAAACCQSSVTAQVPLGPKPACPPGCKIVEEIVMKEQPRFCCEVVPKIKKKWVYDCVEDGFCIPHSPLHQRGCDKVPHCRSCTRKLLVKKEVEVCDGYKCESKKTMETVPCKVYRVVPCAPGEASTAAMPREGAPPAASPPSDRPRLMPYFLLDRLPGASVSRAAAATPAP